jgi:RNA polymerase sigma-70 factor (ECF subfamily)
MEEAATPAPPATSEFEAWVREHHAGLRAFIRALGADEAWVDDLAQEAFIVAYRRFHEFEPGTDFGKWLRGIARRLLANERRKEARHSRLLPFAVADMLLRHEPGHHTAALKFDELLPALRECVGQLPPRSRDLLHRRYAENENAVTLARRLRIKADAVRQQLLRIRVLVKECIEKKGAGGWA